MNHSFYSALLLTLTHTFHGVFFHVLLVLLHCSNTGVVQEFPQSLQVCNGLIHQLRVTGNRLQPVENTTSSSVLLLIGLHDVAFN